MALVLGRGALTPLGAVLSLVTLVATGLLVPQTSPPGQPTCGQAYLDLTCRRPPYLIGNVLFRNQLKAFPGLQAFLAFP